MDPVRKNDQEIPANTETRNHAATEVSNGIDGAFLKPYDSQNTESRIYEMWENSGYFNPDNLPCASCRDPYTIVMPPPNANGDLHAGHALFITLEDILIRFKRMMGYRALWIPGADHAGFETQVVYEKKLEKEGRSRFQMEPQELYDEIYAFTLANKKNMETQVRMMGASCDWSREKFTLDPDVVTRVQEVFIKMFSDGLVYRGKRTVNWCPKHQTSLSDVETANVEETAPLYYFKYGPFTIATARPETKFGDKYVVMHPDDTRYAAWKHGQTIDLEWINGPITATVIKDEAIDPAFGTGVMTITPWHDATDFEIAKRHNLPFEQIIDWRGKLLPIAGEFAGMKILAARPKIIETLQRKGLVTKIDEQYQHVAKRCYKCNTLIEPQVKDQWFVKMAPLAQQAIEAINNGSVRFIPENYEKIFRYWMENALDWNISRQIVWGIPIPAWFKNRGTDTEEMAASLERPDGDGWEADTDTFDTWFSSGQWPLLVTDFPTGKDFPTYYPTDVMETGHDLIFKWIPRMVIFGLYLAKQAPFHTVYLHGLVNDAQGKKMSKSKGNVISPLTLTEKYGTDALRMALVVGNTPGTDVALREDKVKGYKHFSNKLWNIARFVLERTEEVPIATPLESDDSALRDEMASVAADVTKDLEAYRIHLAAEKLYHFAWHRFADEIIEASKPLLAGEDEGVRRSRSALLRLMLDRTLRLLHPFMPFVTEEIWQRIPNQKEKLLMTAVWIG
ncbi:MAG: valine--tRNA ligase [Parcubacteria group bacterium 21-54-25]|nr:MAG: valine--tRNA ligase [Parcubacteria group bacterium 21-54-25]HQU08143.1 valine--tRNA ligase [Candidatus Paceibacterota bacterium]